MKRRVFFLLLACACIVGCRGSSAVSPNTLPAAPIAGPQTDGREAKPQTNVNELPEPPVVRAINGVAKFTLIADINPATGLPGFLYDGVHGVAPTIDIEPGERFEIELMDELPATGGLASLINLHFHGFGSAPKRPGDDVLGVFAKPGQTLHYEVVVPKNQQPGLYWYHAHIHGETSYQVGEGGMSGAIVVEGLEKHFPALAKMRKRVIIVRATGVGINAPPQDQNGAAANETSDDGMGSMGAMPDATARPLNSNTHPCNFNDHLTVTLNGAYRPVITIAPGEKQFFRVVNATGHKTLKLNVQGETVQVLAIDGFALDTYPGTGPTETMSDVIIPPAARAEFIVTGPKSGVGKFRTLCYNTGPNGDPDIGVFLAHLEAPHKTSGGYFSNQPLAVGAPLPNNVYTQKLPPPVTRRVVVFSEDAKPHFFINGKSFKMNAKPMFVVHTGTTEEWHVVNVTQEIHDFHIHQIHFLVQKINGIALQHPYWADSVVIPHRYLVGTKAVDGSLDLLMNFMSPIIKGEFLFHCHILDHEDEGMMAKIEAI
jgi:FtsP/CotA-like multicopper oxidase with cupredoxin domain